VRMKKYIVEMQSVSPLLLNTRQRVLDLEMKKLKKDQFEEWEEKNWRRKAEVNSKGEVIIPVRWFRGAFINSCKFTRIVPHFASTKNSTYTKYAESMVFQNCKFTYKVKDLKEFGAFVGAQGKNSSTKVWRIRPMIPKWKTTIEVIDTGGRMLKEEMKEIFENAGIIIGIGDGRAVAYGRFEVLSIKEKK